ncbi:MAG: DUF1700 domain-containing protein [Clostridia bacterium]|jgi:uncharacterized membrane protein|nr:DUF1700 domain-containing protein [Clostridia bacterium]
MNKKDFLKKLEELLEGVPEKGEIIYDYKEHFDIGNENGKSDSEIIEELGSPEDIAMQYNASLMVSKAEEKMSVVAILKAIASVISLGLLNLFLVMGPVAIIISILVGGFAVAGGIAATGIGIMISAMAYPFVSLVVEQVLVGVSVYLIFFTGLMVFSLGVIVFILGIIFTKYLYKVLLKYLRYNVNLVKRGIDK